jgi:spore maturation protein CgeB
MQNKNGLHESGSRKLRLGYFAHTLRSDWNNGNAHFVRGLMRELRQCGHDVTVYEPETEWSIDNLRTEANGSRSLERFIETYSDLDVQTFEPEASEELWLERLRGMDAVILHEWNSPRLAQMLLRLREENGFKLLFHDTHHRASSSPAQIELFGLTRFDGVLAFGEVLREIYRTRFGLRSVWTLHEAADISVFHPYPDLEKKNELVWIGNWAEGERSDEIRNYLLEPASQLRDVAHTTIYGVRYPEDALESLRAAGTSYGGYIANLDAPEVYARAKATVHVPRQQYNGAMKGIPTIRVFEALGCGIPLVSAPWVDSENLFRPGDFRWAPNSVEMEAALRVLLTDRAAAEDQAARGLETILARHTCAHRAQELTGILEEVIG